MSPLPMSTTIQFLRVTFSVKRITNSMVSRIDLNLRICLCRSEVPLIFNNSEVVYPPYHFSMVSTKSMSLQEKSLPGDSLPKIRIPVSATFMILEISPPTCWLQTTQQTYSGQTSLTYLELSLVSHRALLSSNLPQTCRRFQKSLGTISASLLSAK